jgi:hypothetical protein
MVKFTRKELAGERHARAGDHFRSAPSWPTLGGGLECTDVFVHARHEIIVPVASRIAFDLDEVRSSVGEKGLTSPPSNIGPRQERLEQPLELPKKVVDVGIECA